MTTFPKNPFKNLKLDSEEQEIEKAIESGKLVARKPTKQELKKYQAAAKATLNKMHNINIRLTIGDLYKIKVKAIEEGMPYQTLVSSIIHKYTSGRLKSV